MAINWLYCGPYPIKLGVTKSKAAYLAEMKVAGIDDDEFLLEGSRATTQVYAVDGQTRIIVCVSDHKPRPSRSEFAGVIAHEAVHVFRYTMKAMREENPGEEIEAYGVQYFTMMILGELWNHK